MKELFVACIILLSCDVIYAQTSTRRVDSKQEPYFVVIEFLDGNGLTKNFDKTITLNSLECKAVLQKFNLSEAKLMPFRANFNLADTSARLPSGQVIKDVDYSNFLQIEVLNMEQARNLASHLNQLKSIVFNAYVKPRKMIIFEDY
jgi:hypothetical protein